MDSSETERVEAQKRIARLAEVFDAVFRLTGDLFFRLDAAGEVVDYRALESAPPASRAFMSSHLEDLLPSDLAQVFKDSAREVTCTGEMRVVEYKSPSTRVPGIWEARFLPLEDGDVAVVCRDITERVRQQQDLVASGERFRKQRDFLDLLLETLDSGVIVVKGDPAVVQRVNGPAARLIGYEPEELVGGSTRVFHRNDEEWRQFSEISRQVRAEGNTASAQVRMARRDGTEFDAEVCVRGLGREGADRIGIIRDVSERTAAEQMLRESEMRFRSIVEGAPFGLLLYDLRDGILFLTGSNAAADRILGIDHASRLGCTLEEAFPQAADASWPNIFRTLAEEGGSWRSEVPYDDGNIKGVFETSAFQTSPGRIAVAFVDVTERRAIDNADRIHQRRVSAMAAQLGSAEDRERRRLAEELHDRVGQALAVSRMHLAAAVDDNGRLERREFEAALHMLEDAIRETRAVTTELYPPVLCELGLGSALRWLGEEFESTHGLQCTVTVPDQPIAVGEEEQNLLFRSARELLINVVKHAGTSRAWVSLDLVANSVLLTVSDQGCGISSWSSDNDGFGLFSIRERLPYLGGSMDVETAPGEGTRVTLSIPDREAEQAPLAPLPSQLRGRRPGENHP